MPKVPVRPVIRLAVLSGLLAGILSILIASPARAADAGVRWVIQDLQKLPDPEVLVMSMDDQGNKWFGTRKGLTRLNLIGDWETFTVESTRGGLKSNVITALAIGENRELWIGTEAGVSQFVNGSWKAYTRETTAGGLPDNFINAMAIGREEKWFATRNGFAMLRGSAWNTYSADKISGRLPNKGVTALAMDSAGNKWLGTIGGLVRFAGSSWTLYTKESTNGGLPHNSITYITASPLGDIWVGTQMGLGRLSGNVWTSFKQEPSLGEIAAEPVYRLACESKAAGGSLWMAAKGGAARFNGVNWTQFNKNNTTGIQTRFVYSVMPGQNGEVWFGTQKGVSQMVPLPEE